MSVIFGKVYLDQRSVEADDLDIMQNRLQHWKADATGCWRQDCTGLGHLMLYNTPESLSERLPFYDIESSVSITADARIDNREDLYQKLGLKTPEERSIPDSSIILMLYKKYGTNCIKHLIGDFAFAIWDERTQTLFCARDHMGVKPFFYYVDERIFAFASEKKGILAIPDTNKEINRLFFYNQLYLPPEQGPTNTLYKHIKRLPSAHILILNKAQKKLEIEQYWTLDTETETLLKQPEDYCEALKYHFEKAVECRLRTNFGLGIELSGGLDSSAITGAACKLSGSNHLTTFSSTLASHIKDEAAIKKSERRFMEAVIDFNRIKNPVFITDNFYKDPVEEVDFGLDVNDGLEMWNMPSLVDLKRSAMEKNVRTLLSGFPGDEMVTYKGKHFYLDLLDKGMYQKYFTSAKSAGDLFSRITPLLPYTIAYNIHKIRNLVNLGKTAHTPFSIPLQYRYQRRDARWQDPDFKNRFVSYRHFLKAKLLKTQVAMRMESETRYGIYFKLEPRFPMADIRLTQFYLSMPNHMKYGGDINRSTFRKSMNEYMPEAVLKRGTKDTTIAPYRKTKEELHKRQKLAKAILLRMPKNDLLTPRNEHVTLYLHIDSLRWFEKNFQIL
ncbi:MAG: asparagine synthetase B [Sphingobacteriales bacterium]|nr:MAG: asparagine synthetase B [Sphingobacteriales bacterium]